jgi:hypothetical protein
LAPAFIIGRAFSAVFGGDSYLVVRRCSLLAVFEILVLTAHLLCVNVAAGGPILAVWLEWRGDDLARRAARYLAAASLLGLLVGGLLGVLLGWLKWTPDYQSLWTGPLSYKMHWAAAELLFSLLLAGLYWWLVNRAGGSSRGARFGRGAIALLNGTNLLYHFPPLFLVASQLHTAGQTSGEVIRGAAFRQFMTSGVTPALVVHIGFASLAVAALALLGLALRAARHGDSAAASQFALWGGRWSLAASLVQLPVGLWTLATLSAVEQSRLMGNDPLATGLFLAAMLSACWLLRELATVALGETTRGAMIRAMSAMLIVVGLMAAMQQAARPATAVSAAATLSTVPSPENP